MPAVLWVLAIGSYWTFAHRMYHTWYELNRATNKPSEEEEARPASSSTPGPERRAEQPLITKAG
jgi:hypothetical protein